MTAPSTAAAGARPTHLVRLGLDLQVDGLLFTVSAATSAHRDGGCPAQEPADPTWRRWLEEDLEAVLDLAAVVVEGDGELPAPISGACNRPERVVDDLRARYRTLLGLVCEAAQDGVPSSRLARLARHYEGRLRDLDTLLGGPRRPRQRTA